MLISVRSDCTSRYMRVDLNVHVLISGGSGGELISFLHLVGGSGVPNGIIPGWDPVRVIYVGLE